MAKICTSASRQRNDEARTSTFPAGTPAVSGWQGFLWRLVEKPSEPLSTQSQHAHSRRREAAILIQHMVRWRLTRGDVLAPIGTTMTGFDASNAFMSVHHTTLDKLVEASFEDEMDRALMKQRYSGAQISVCANSDTGRRYWPFSFQRCLQ